jgi:hypothetical protein
MPRRQAIRQSSTVRSWIVGIWLLSFLWCLIVPLVLRAFIPHQFANVLREAIDTFAPTLTIMLCFIFAGPGNASVRKMNASRAGVLAILLTAVYCSVFAFITWEFYAERLTAVDLIEEYRTIRPVLGFLVSAAVAFYFATPRHDAITSQSR